MYFIGLIFDLMSVDNSVMFSSHLRLYMLCYFRNGCFCYYCCMWNNYDYDIFWLCLQ